MNKYNHVMLPSPAVQKVKTIYEMIFHLSNQTTKKRWIVLQIFLAMLETDEEKERFEQFYYK